MRRADTLSRATVLSRRTFLTTIAAAGLASRPAALAAKYQGRLIVDSQSHIWLPHSTDRPWANPTQKPQMPEPFSAQRLIQGMDAAGVDRVVLVPPSWVGAEQGNAYCQEAVRAFPGRFGIIALGPAIDRPDQLKLIPTWRNQPGVLGARVNLDRAAITTGAAEPFFAAAEKAALPLCFLGQNDLVGGIAERHPGLPLIVDHMGISEAFMTANPNWGREIDEVVVGLAKYQNVSVKLSSIAFLSSQPYPWRDIIPHIQRCFDAFGPLRCHWGSDQTHSFDRATYLQRITQFTEELPFLSESDKDWIMGRSLLARLRWP